MLIPIGFFGAGAAAGAYELISTAYGTGSSGTITFSSIPSTYKHLQIRLVNRDSVAADTAGYIMTMNGDTPFSGTNYTTHRLTGNGTTVASSFPSGVSGGEISSADGVGASAATGIHGAAIIDILDYASTSKYKTVRSLGGHVSTAKVIELMSGMRMQTTAVTSITFTANANWTTTSRFSLYGIKG